jgi:hypothetical protein
VAETWLTYRELAQALDISPELHAKSPSVDTGHGNGATMARLASLSISKPRKPLTRLVDARTTTWTNTRTNAVRSRPWKPTSPR